jgi:hypothetical protein
MGRVPGPYQVLPTDAAGREAQGFGRKAESLSIPGRSELRAKPLSRSDADSEFTSFSTKHLLSFLLLGPLAICHRHLAGAWFAILSTEWSM